jgi:hypothetical protein
MKCSGVANDIGRGGQFILQSPFVNEAGTHSSIDVPDAGIVSFIQRPSDKVQQQ